MTAARPFPGALEFGRVRQIHYAIIGLILIGGAAFLLQGSALALPGGGGLTIPWDVLLPLGSACVISMTTRSPLNELEAGAARPLWALRAAHLSILLTAGVTISFAATWSLPDPYSWPSVLRNLAGFVGLGLIGARFLGGRLAWIPAIAFGLATLLAGTANGEPRAWAWPLLTDTDTPSYVIAMALLASGYVLLVSGGTREAPGDA